MASLFWRGHCFLRDIWPMNSLTRACFLAALALFLTKCNYWGNPHRRAAAPRVVPVADDGILLESLRWRRGAKERPDTLDVQLQRNDLAGFELRLGEAKGVKLLGAEKQESAGRFVISLTIKRKAPVRWVPLVFYRGNNWFTYQCPLSR
jgi:hypothetical protein